MGHPRHWPKSVAHSRPRVHTQLTLPCPECKHSSYCPACTHSSPCPAMSAHTTHPALPCVCTQLTLPCPEYTHSSPPALSPVHTQHGYSPLLSWVSEHVWFRPHILHAWGIPVGVLSTGELPSCSLAPGNPLPLLLPVVLCGQSHNGLAWILGTLGFFRPQTHLLDKSRRVPSQDPSFVLRAKQPSGD